MWGGKTLPQIKNFHHILLAVSYEASCREVGYLCNAITSLPANNLIITAFITVLPIHRSNVIDTKS